MTQGNQTKAERRQARAAAGGGKAERKQAGASGGRTKAERKRAKAGRKGGGGPAKATVEPLGEDASAEERIEWRLARIEEAVAAQSERSEELLQRVNELLESGSEITDTP